MIQITLWMPLQKLTTISNDKCQKDQKMDCPHLLGHLSIPSQLQQKRLAMIPPNCPSIHSLEQKTWHIAHLLQTTLLPKKADTPFKTFALVYDLQIASDVYAHSMNTQVTLTQCKLLLLSPKVRNQVQEATSSRQVVKPGEPAALVDSNLLDIFDSMDAVADNNDTVQCKAVQLAAMPTVYTITVSSFTFSTVKPPDSAGRSTSSNANPPPSAMVIDDPYKVYLHTVLDDHGFYFLTVAKELSALCTILLLFNHNKYIESIVDPGSQVIAMLEVACYALC